jgi:hypothetical protein
MTQSPARYIFTLTGGRTGTAWIAELLKQNLGIAAVHELLGIDDFGTRMPSIRVMRSFNDRGSDEFVRGFWNNKLAEIAELSGYAEANHTLGKCGLIENLAASPMASEAVVLVVRRAKLPQCLSHIMRGDFLNITVNWQWYLDPGYRNVIVNPQPFLRFGQMGQTMWYLHEMEARQLYYLRTYAQRVRMIEVDFSTMTTQAGAEALLAELGHAGAVRLPPARNQSHQKPPPELARSAEAMLQGIVWDVASVVDGYLAAGRRLDPLAP